MSPHRHRPHSASWFALQADRVARRLWRGLLPPPPYQHDTARQKVSVVGRWVARWVPHVRSL